MSDFFAKLEGGEELRSKLAGIRRQFLDEMKAAIPAEAEELLRAAQTLAPVETGQLRASAGVSTETESRGVRSVVAYSDEKAAAVHEGVHGGRKVKGTKGFKWLERALNAYEDSFVKRVAARLRRLVGD